MAGTYLSPDPDTWSTSEVIQWLHMIEAPRYAKAFRSRAITGQDLINLRENDLVNLGIMDPIARRRVFLEIQLLKTSSNKLAQVAPTSSSSLLDEQLEYNHDSLLEMRRPQSSRLKKGHSRTLSSASSISKCTRQHSNKSIDLSDSENHVSLVSDQLMLEERRKIQSLIAQLVNTMDILRSLRRTDNQNKNESSSSDSDSDNDDDDEQWPEGPTPTMYRRQRALNLAGLDRPEEAESPDKSAGKNITMFSGVLEEEANKKSKKKHRDHWYEVMGSKSGQTAKEIAEQYRMDLSFKKVRRGSRILPRTNTLGSVSSHDNDDIGDEETPAVIHPWVILPTNRYRLAWDIVMMLLVIYYGLITPVNMAFHDAISNFIMDTIFNGLFIVDICLNFLTAFYIEKGPRQGQLEVQLPEIRKAYMKKWFWVDLLASIPLDIIFNAAGFEINASFNKLVRLVRGFKLIRVIKMSRAVKRLTQGHRTNPGMSRLVKNILFLVISWHWMGCAYWFVADWIGFGDRWTPDRTMIDGDLSLQYLQAFYWSLAATTSVGKNLQPFDSLTTWFTLTMVFCGVIFMAFVIGSSSIALEDLDTADNEKRSRIEAINNFFAEKYDMDARLKKKIVSYYDYMLTRSAGFQLLNDLHTTLKSELTWNLHENLITKIPIFDDLSQECISAIIRELTPKTFLPKEYICLQGERMTVMFFILSGRVAVVDISNKKMKTMTILKDGGFFGERCVIDNSRMKETMQAISYCDILLLHKQQIKRLIRYHTEFLLAIHRHVYKKETMLHWQKVQFVLNNIRMLHLIGNDIGFEELYPQFNFINISKGSGNKEEDNDEPI